MTMRIEGIEGKNGTVFLCGLKSCGKTTIANDVADRLGCPWIDCDEEMLKRNPQYESCRALFKALGEKAFRNEESLAVESIAKQCRKNGKKTIVSLGGGACDANNVLQTSKTNGILIYLQQSEHVLFERLKANGLPAYLSGGDDNGNAKQHFHELYMRRDEIYSCFADYVIQLSDCTREEAVETICRMLMES